MLSIPQKCKNVSLLQNITSKTKYIPHPWPAMYIWLHFKSNCNDSVADFISYDYTNIIQQKIFIWNHIDLYVQIVLYLRMLRTPRLQSQICCSPF